MYGMTIGITWFSLCFRNSNVTELWVFDDSDYESEKMRDDAQAVHAIWLDVSSFPP